MTKVVDKKALLVLLSLVLAICWLAVPVSAAELTDCDDYCAECAGVLCIDDIDKMQTRSVSSSFIDEIRVYAYGGIDNEGKPIKVTMGGVYGYAKGPATILVCRLPNALTSGMAIHGYDKYLCYLTFSVEGTNLQRYTVKVDNTVVINKTLSDEGKVTVYWTCPVKKSTSYEVAVYSDDNSKISKGTIIR